MSSEFYNEQIPDSRDIENKTQKRPGFKLGVYENDGGIIVSMEPIETVRDIERQYLGWLTIEEAKAFIDAFQEAVERAEGKK